MSKIPIPKKSTVVPADDDSSDSEGLVPKFDLSDFNLEDSYDEDEDEDEGGYRDSDDDSDDDSDEDSEDSEEFISVTSELGKLISSARNKIPARQSVVPTLLPKKTGIEPIRPPPPKVGGLKLEISPAFSPVKTQPLQLAPKSAQTILAQTKNVPQRTVSLPIRQTQGLTLSITQPKSAPVPLKSPADIAAILSKMPGINVSYVTPTPDNVVPDINDLLHVEADETTNDFEVRRQLTLKLASIPGYKLNNVTAVTAAIMMMKKAKLGLMYDVDIESAISYLTSILQKY
jgi:hypothetical protein